MLAIRFIQGSCFFLRYQFANANSVSKLHEISYQKIKINLKIMKTINSIPKKLIYPITNILL